MFVGVQADENAAQDGIAGRVGGRGDFEVAVEFEEFGEEGQDEGEGDLGIWGLVWFGSSLRLDWWKRGKEGRKSSYQVE